MEELMQQSLFGEEYMPEPAKKTGMTVVGKKGRKELRNVDRDRFRAHYYNGGAAEVRYMTLDEMFGGYDKIQIVTFSVNMAFVDGIISRFREAELVIGGHFLRNTMEVNEMIAEMLVNGRTIPKLLASYGNVCGKMIDGTIRVYADACSSIHSKLYLLQADDGKCRVIAGSANLTFGGWDGRLYETLIVDDNPASFDGYRFEFESMRDICVDVPYHYVEADITADGTIEAEEDVLKNNPVVNRILECGSLALVQDDNINNVIFAKQIDAFRKLGKEQVIKLIGKKKYKTDENGITEVRRKDIDAFSKKGARIKKETAQDATEKNIPVLTVDYDERKIYLDGKEIIRPEPQDIKTSIKAMYKIFDFRHFIDNNGELKRNHYKVMNHVFCSPFMAYMFKTAQRHKMSSNACPMASLSMSKKADSGKTTMLKAFLRMMTGMSIPVYSKAECNIDWVRGVVAGSNSVLPVIIDDVDNQWITKVGGEIKTAMETNGTEQTPVFLISSNKEVVKPGDAVQKRMTIMQFDAGIEKDVDRVSFNTTGNEMMDELSVSLWNEYALRMVDVVAEECEKIRNGEYKGTGRYPDILNMSSKVLLGILREYGEMPVPGFMTEVGYTADYDRFCTDVTLEGLRNDYLSLGSRAFAVKDNLIVYFTGKSDGKKLKSYEASLPQELKPVFRELRDESVLEMDLEAFGKLVAKVERSFTQQIKSLVKKLYSK